MTNVLISERPRLISIYEFQHDYKIVNNRSYAINAVDKAISRGQTTIQLDKSKLQHKVYTGTHCYMYNRLGEYMSIQANPFGLESHKRYAVVEGYSRPQHSDRFARFDGRYNALRNAYSAMKLLKTDPNFNDLLKVKRFINTFELETNCTTVSYQFMDLWLAILSNNNDDIAEAGKNYVGLEQYNDWFVDCLLEFNKTNTEYEICEGVLSCIDKYRLFKQYIKRCNLSLY